MAFVKGFHKLSDVLDTICSYIIVVMLGAMVVITGAQIVCRMAFTALSWSEEATRYLLVWSSFLGASCVYKHSGHISITFVQDMVPAALSKVLKLLVHVVCTILFVVVIIYGMKYFGKQGNQLSAAMRLPMKYIYLCIPVGCGFMLVHAVDAVLGLLFGKAALLFISFIVLLLIGVPVAFAIAAAALLVLLKGDVKLLILVQRMFASTDSFSLIAVPFFIFAGDLLAKGKVSKVLVEFAESLLGMLKGGLSIVSVLAGMFFAAISGSGAATTAAVGATLIPELKKRGYREDSAAALIAAAGTIGVVIPPSVPMVLYAVISEDSVNTLFKNGFIPGILMGVILVAISLYQARKFNYPKGKAFSVGNVLHTFKEAIWGILMPLIILGGIFSGYFTPSEAAAVAVIYAIFVSFFIYRDLDFKGLVEIMKGSAKTSAVIMIIIACSGPFGWVLANYKIPEAIASGVLGISTNKYVIMFLISLIILLAGVFMETSSAIIILSPVFLPLVKAMGISTVHFGILFVVGIAIGMITPPVAINLFVASGITGLPIERISKSVIPYLIGLIIVFFMIVYVPLLIPGLM